MTTEGTPAAAAGWYPDPTRQNELRYWDGSTWTDHMAPGASAAATAPPPAIGTAPPPMPAAVAAPPGRKPAAERAKTRAILVLIGGGLMAVGALLPWEEASLNGVKIDSVQGLKEGAGGITLAAGLVCAALGVLFLAGKVRAKSGIATLVVSAVTFIFVAGNMSSISDDVDKAKDVTNELVKVDATLGFGIILAVIGCLMVLIASISLLRVKDAPAAV
jgi:hypothetical protein